MTDAERYLIKLTNEVGSGVIESLDEVLAKFPGDYAREAFKVTVLLSVVATLAARYPSPDIATYLRTSINRLHKALASLPRAAG